MAHEDLSRPKGLPSRIVKETILGGGTAAVSSTAVYILAKLSGDNGTLPNYFIPWYMNGSAGQQALPRYAAHAGEIALFVAPVGGLYAAGHELAIRAGAERANDNHLKMLGLAAGSLACYLAAGAWAGGISALRATSEYNLSTDHRIEVAVAVAAGLAGLGGIISNVVTEQPSTLTPSSE